MVEVFGACYMTLLYNRNSAIEQCYVTLFLLCNMLYNMLYKRMLCGVLWQVLFNMCLTFVFPGLPSHARDDPSVSLSHAPTSMPS